MDVTAFVGKLLKEDDADVLKEGVQVLAQAFMEAEVSAQVGARAYERSSERTACRNGYRTRTWDTRVGTIELKIPKLTCGSYFPSLLEPRRRAEKALHAVVVEAYVKGVSTRKVDDLPCHDLDVGCGLTAVGKCETPAGTGDAMGGERE